MVSHYPHPHEHLEQLLLEDLHEVLPIHENNIQMYWTKAMLEALWDLDGRPQVSSKKAVTRHWLLGVGKIINS